MGPSCLVGKPAWRRITRMRGEAVERSPGCSHLPLNPFGGMQHLKQSDGVFLPPYRCSGKALAVAMKPTVVRMLSPPATRPRKRRLSLSLPIVNSCSSCWRQRRR